MDTLMNLPLIADLVFIFVLGTVVGSFLNVLIARLPYEKSPIWPGSRCFSCLQPIPLVYNVPILGYLLLRGRCKHCKAPFSAQYMWVELGTGLALVGLFVLEILLNWHNIPAFGKAKTEILTTGLPPVQAIPFFVLHAFLLVCLLASAVIDAEHRVIPPQITYAGTVIGLIGSALWAWPWPTPVSALAAIQPDMPWVLPEAASKVPTGLTLWPFAGPPPAWAPPGSWTLGLLNGLIGALAGTFVVRSVKFLFEIGLNKEALGLGDADLLMMAGAFLGWQVAVIGFFFGALAALVLYVPNLVLGTVRGRDVGRELSFGPGLAVGVVATWLGWPWVKDTARALFDPFILGIIAAGIGGGILISGLLLRRRK
jgi:leader peptidase (prepilin peptidase)/N-methyltransferase